MSDLIKVQKKTIGNGEVNSVDARELHEFLESKQQFSNWIQNKVDKYSFMKNIDFIAINNSIYSPPRKEYILSIDMAKEISMVENNSKGKQARKYFIKCEKDLKTIQAIDMPDWEKEELAIERFMKRLNVASHLIPVEVTKYVHKIGGPDLRNIVGSLPSSQNILATDIMLEPTEIGKEFKVSAIKMNVILEELGLQEKSNGKWTPTNKGAQICSRHQWSSCGKSGYNLKWNLEKVRKQMEGGIE